jgi:hypothetical protein
MSLSTLDVASPLPSGVANGLSWTQVGTTGYYTASITVPNVTAQTALSCTLQCDASNTTDAYNCWLLTAYPTANTISFIVASDPATRTNFPISWSVVRA